MKAPPRQPGDTHLEFGRRLRHLRVERRLSQDELAHIAQMDRVFLGQLERGQRSASLDTLEKLSGALEVALKDLLDFVTRQPRRDLSAAARLGQRISVLAHGAPQGELERFERIAEVFFAAHRPRRNRR